jgi:hypothetical protein
MPRRSLLCIVLVALGLILHAGNGALAETHRDAARHYSLELPPGWVAMPPEQVKLINDMVAQSMPTANVRYHAGFLPQTMPPGTILYALVQYQPPMGKTYEEIERNVARDFPAGLKQAEGALGDLARNLTVGSPVLDRARSRIIMRFQMQAPPPVGALQGFSVWHLGKEGVVQIHCYAPEKDFQTYSPIFNQLQDSFRFDPGYTFDAASASSSSSAGKKVAIGAIIGGVVGGLAGGAVALVKLLTGKKPKPRRRKRARPRLEEEEETT